MAVSISNAAAQSAVNAVGALPDNGFVRIYSGAVPALADTALGAQVLLAELALSADAFAAATDANPGATSAANTITDDSAANATGTAAFFRIVTSGGAAVLQGSVTAVGGGGDMEIQSTAITAGEPVRITSLTISLAEI